MIFSYSVLYEQKFREIDFQPYGNDTPKIHFRMAGSQNFRQFDEIFIKIEIGNTIFRLIFHILTEWQKVRVVINSVSQTDLFRTVLYTITEHR